MSIYFLYYHRCGVLFRRYLIAADLGGIIVKSFLNVLPFPPIFYDPLKLQIDQINLKLFCE